MAFISFENIAGDGKLKKVPDGFRKLDWNNFIAVDDDYLEARIGNTNAIRTGEEVAFTVKRSTGFRSPDRDDDFDLNNGYFTSLGAEDLSFKVLGFDDGEKVATKVLTLDTEREFVRFGAQFDGIDEVRFKASGIFAVDDLFIDF